MPKKTGLGRGLGSLLGDEAVMAADTETVASIAAEPAPEGEKLSAAKTMKIADIAPNPDQPRRVFDEAALGALANSIKKYGVLQPIAVRWSARNRVYIIVAGERRWRASRMAGLTVIPCVVAQVTEQDAYELSLIENLMREDLNPIEEALGYRTLVEKYHLSEAEIGERLGRDRSTISNAIRLLTLDAEVLERLETGELSRGHARTLVTVPQERQADIADKIVRGALSVRETENLIRRQGEGPKARPRKEEQAANSKSVVNYAKELSRELEKKLVRRVKLEVKPRGDSGWIMLEFQGLDDLDKIIKSLTESNN